MSFPTILTWDEILTATLHGTTSTESVYLEPHQQKGDVLRGTEVIVQEFHSILGNKVIKTS